MAKYNKSIKYKDIRDLHCEKEKVGKIVQSFSKAIHNKEYRSRIVKLIIAWFVCLTTSFYLSVWLEP